MQGRLLRQEAANLMMKPCSALSPGTISLSLKYDFNELMTVGELTFEEFLNHYHRQKHAWLFIIAAALLKH